MISVGTEADVTGYQQLWEHFSQLSDSQDGWIVWDICRSASSILVEKGKGEKGKEKEESERRKREEIKRMEGEMAYRTILSNIPHSKCLPFWLLSALQN